MKKTKLKLMAIAIFAIAFANTSFAQVITPANCFPPASGQFSAAQLGSYVNGDQVSIPVLSNFTGCNPPPPAGSGATTVHTFGAALSGTRTHNGVPTQFSAPVQMTVRITDAGPAAGGGEMYQTEMLQLDVQGGTLPPGVQIRESPTLQSTGQTTVKPVAGGFQIDSFFDVFTELTVDGGASWNPSVSGPSHIVLQPFGSGIPTLGQWGLIVFALLMFAVAMVVVKRRQAQLAVAGKK